jgi:hypothetical protein
MFSPGAAEMPHSRVIITVTFSYICFYDTSRAKSIILYEFIPKCVVSGYTACAAYAHRDVVKRGVDILEALRHTPHVYQCIYLYL